MRCKLWTKQLFFCLRKVFFFLSSFDIENKLKADMLKFIYETNTNGNEYERMNNNTQAALWLCVEIVSASSDSNGFH